MQQQGFTDQLGRFVSINFPPRRIISLVPSQTELLFYLGLDEQLIGVTKFCTHPANKVKAVTKVGGTKKLDLQLIRDLQPDLIIGNKEENEQSQIEILMQEFPVWMSDICDVDDALQMIKDIGEVTNRATNAKHLIEKIKAGFSTLPSPFKPLKIAYLIWQKPYMVAAKQTFINDMLQRCGYANAFDAERYPQVTAEDLAGAQPDVIMLSSEPFPFTEKHAESLREVCPQSKVILVDGEMFSWYGSRMLQAIEYFRSLIANLNNSLI